MKENNDEEGDVSRLRRYSIFKDYDRKSIEAVVENTRPEMPRISGAQHHNNVPTPLQMRVEFDDIRQHYGRHSRKTVVTVDDLEANYRSVLPLRVERNDEDYQRDNGNQVC